MLQAAGAKAGRSPSVPTGSVTVPKSPCTRFGTGALPIVTQSLLSTLPNAALPASSQLPTVASPALPTVASPAGSPQPVASQSEGTDLPTADEPEGTSLPTAAHPMGNRLPATGEEDLVAQRADDDVPERHVWGATLTRSQGHLVMESSDDSATVVPMRSGRRRGAGRAVTPQTLHK